MSDIRYPLAKDKISPAIWSVLHNYTALKVTNPATPRKLKATERAKYRILINESIEAIGCEECKVHAKEYIKVHPPNFRTDIEAFNYTCAFHNSVNQKLGKPTYDCSTMLGAPTCPTCSHQNIKNTEGNTNPNQELAPVPIKQSLVQDTFQDYKNVSQRVVENMCQEAGVPVPQVLFQECPGNKQTSCTHLPLTPDGKHYKGAPVKIYLNPIQYSPRTVIHETRHYIESYKGNPHISEQEVEKQTLTLLAKHFPQDKVIKNNASSIYRMDSPTPPSFKERIEARMRSWKETFPTYANMGAPTIPPTAQPVVAQAQAQPQQVTPIMGRPIPEMEPAPEPERGVSDGFMSMLDPVFSPIGNALGLSAKDVNEAHTPALIATVYNGVSDIYLNTFGSFLTSLLGATATLLAGTLGKEQIVYSDRKFLVETGANLLWNPLRYIINPRSQEDLMKDAKSFGTALSTFNVDEIKDAVIYKPPPKTFAASDLSPAQVRTLQKAGMPPTPKQDIARGVVQTTQRVGGPEGGREYEVVGSGKENYPPPIDEEDMFDDDPLAKPLRTQFNRISLG